MEQTSDFNIYRVRKSWDDIKSQKGAYFMLETAIKRAFLTKRNVYDSNKTCVWEYRKNIKRRKRK